MYVHNRIDPDFVVDFVFVLLWLWLVCFNSQRDNINVLTQEAKAKHRIIYLHRTEWNLSDCESGAAVWTLKDNQQSYSLELYPLFLDLIQVVLYLCIYVSGGKTIAIY